MRLSRSEILEKLVRAQERELELREYISDLEDYATKEEFAALHDLVCRVNIRLGELEK
jgi:hypothetical protein